MVLSPRYTLSCGDLTFCATVVSGLSGAEVERGGTSLAAGPGGGGPRCDVTLDRGSE